MTLALVARADAYLYWTSGKAIGRANLDGTNATGSFIADAASPYVTGVGVDAAHIYWANFNGGTIGRANLDGTGVEKKFITGVGFPGRNRRRRRPCVLGRASARAQSAARTSTVSAVETSFITGAGIPEDVAVDAGHIYWANFAGSVGRANLDGSGVDPDFIPRPLAQPGDARSRCWPRRPGRAPPNGCANIDGTRKKTFLTDVGITSGVAVDAAHIYWGHWGISNDTIARLRTLTAPASK